MEFFPKNVFVTCLKTDLSSDKRGINRNEEERTSEHVATPSLENLEKTFREATASMGSFWRLEKAQFRNTGSMMFLETCLETDAQVLTQVLPRWLHRRNRR